MTAQEKQDKLRLVTILTLVRFPLVLLFFVAAVIEAFKPSTVLFLTALFFMIASAITDLFDGYLARKLAQMTEFGAFLDPVADKLMVAIALVLLVEQHDTILFTLATCVIIGREFVISALRELMAELGQRTSVAVSYIGKVKTFVQMLAIVVLLALDPNTSPQWMLLVGYLMLYLAAVLTLWSMMVYLKAGWKVLEERQN